MLEHLFLNLYMKILHTHIIFSTEDECDGKFRVTGGYKCHCMHRMTECVWWQNNELQHNCIQITNFTVSIQYQAFIQCAGIPFVSGSSTWTRIREYSWPICKARFRCPPRSLIVRWSQLKPVSFTCQSQPKTCPLQLQWHSCQPQSHLGRPRTQLPQPPSYRPFLLWRAWVGSESMQTPCQRRMPC